MMASKVTSAGWGHERTETTCMTNQMGPVQFSPCAHGSKCDAQKPPPNNQMCTAFFGEVKVQILKVVNVVFFDVRANRSNFGPTSTSTKWASKCATPTRGTARPDGATQVMQVMNFIDSRSLFVCEHLKLDRYRVRAIKSGATAWKPAWLRS